MFALQHFDTGRLTVYLVYSHSPEDCNHNEARPDCVWNAELASTRLEASLDLT